MIKKILIILEKCLRYLMAITLIPFFNIFINIIIIKKEDFDAIEIMDKIMFFIFPVLIIGYIIVLFLTHYCESKEIAKTPLNDNSAKKINLLLRYFSKTIKKLDKKIKRGKEFRIIFPKYDFSKNKLYKNGNIIVVNESNKKEIIQEICDDIISLKRTLLEINKSNLRIDLGKFLINHTTNIKQKIDGYIDFLGWSKLLNGNKNGINDIMKGIDICITKMNTCINENNIEEANNYIFTIVRGYRHLGTTYYTYKINPSLVENSINSAYNFLTKIEDHKNIDKEKYTRLAVGIKYNNILFKYYDCIYNETSENDLNTVKEEIKKLYDSIYNSKQISLYDAINVNKLNNKYLDINYIDNHRKIKICSLYASLFENKDSLRSLKEVEDILGKNIYIDEAVELYIYDKLNNIN